MTKKIFVGVLTLVVSASAQAEWVSIGNDLYIDDRSQSKNGDIGKIDVRVGSGYPSPMSFDCKYKLILKEGGSIPIKPNSVAETAYEYACRNRWYEVWKK